MDYVHGDSPGKNTGVDCYAFLQGIFSTQGLNITTPTLQADSLPSDPVKKKNNTLDQMNLIDIYRAFHLKAE